MSTHTTATFVGASQGSDARVTQVQGKQVQRAEHGKIGSAGFAQILGEQVAKSATQAETGEKAGQRLTPNDVSTHSHNAPTQTSPQSWPHPSIQPTPMASDNKASQVRVHSGLAQQIRPETSGQRSDASHADRLPILHRQGMPPALPQSQGGKTAPTVGEETQPCTQPVAQAIASSGQSSLLPAKPDSSATNAKPSKPAAIPSAGIGRAVYKLAGEPENPPKQTMAPTSETQSTRPPQAKVAHNGAHATYSLPASGSTLRTVGAPQPTDATDGQSPSSIATPTAATKIPKSSHLAAPPIKPASPQPALKPESSPSLRVRAGEGQELAHGASVAETPVEHTQVPSTVLTSAPIRGQLPAHPPAANRVETALHVPNQTHDITVPAQQTATATPAAPKMGHSAASATVQPRLAVGQVKTSTSEITAHLPSPPLPHAVPANAPEHSAAPTSADKGVGSSTAAATSRAHAVTPSPAAKASDISEDGASVVVATQAPEISHPASGTAPRTMAPAIQEHATTHPAAEPPAHDRKENAPVQSPVHASQHTVDAASPPQERKTQKRPAGTPTTLVEQTQSPNVPPPSPNTVAQESSAKHVAKNQAPANPTEKITPAATERASAKPARPAMVRPSVPEESKPPESTPDLKPPESNTNHAATNNGSTARATTDKPVPLGLQNPAASPTPQAGHAGSTTTVRVETAASKRRTHIENEKDKEQEEANAEPGKPTPTVQQASHAFPSEGLEIKVPKLDLSSPMEHKNSTETSSQTSSLQSPVNQPRTFKEGSPPVVLPNAERATVFVSQNTFMPASSEAGVRDAAKASSVAAGTAGLVDLAVEDPGLSVNVMPHSAHLSITGDAGDLSLHVRVRDGSADVNVSGSMAPLFDTKAPEMRTALAGEGLQLGNFATDQRGGSPGQQGQPESAPRTNDPNPPPTPRRTTTAIPEVQIAADRRIHVTA